MYSSSYLPLPTDVPSVSYSSLIHGLAKNNIELDRKILSDIAINDSASFEVILKKATS